MNSTRYINMLLTARMQARMAVAMYEGHAALLSLVSDIREENQPKDIRVEAMWCEDRHIRAGALIFRDHVHISICGTNDANDHHDNFRARQILGVHRGYSEAANYLYREFERKRLLDELRFNPLVIGGHSAGGAIAQVMTKRVYMEPREVVTFGSPRVFSPKIATDYAVNYPWPTWRFVCSGDPIPRLPLRKFRCLFGGAEFKHTPAAMYLGDDGEVRLADEAGQIRKVVDLAASAIGWTVTSAAAALGMMPQLIRSKHSMQRYAAAIDRAIERVSE